MSRITIDIPDQALEAARVSADEAEALARKSIAMELYVNHGLSLGWCTEISGIDKESFIKYLGQHKVSIFNFDDEKEFLKEIATA